MAPEPRIVHADEWLAVIEKPPGLVVHAAPGHRGPTLVDLLQFPPTRELSIAMMKEAEAIANKLGVKFRVGIDKRIAGAEKVGKHKTSMLQDVEAGKPLEYEALVGAVVELGKLTGTPTPHIDAVYACVSLLAKTLAEQHGKLRVQSS